MNLLIQLRKVVNHPFMFPEADLNPHETGDSIVTSSAKMMVLDRILNKLKAQGRRALVYSQFTTMLDVIQDYCQVHTCKTCHRPVPFLSPQNLGTSESRGCFALTPFF